MNPRSLFRLPCRRDYHRGQKLDHFRSSIVPSTTELVLLSPNPRSANASSDAVPAPGFRLPQGCRTNFLRHQHQVDMCMIPGPWPIRLSEQRSSYPPPDLRGDSSKTVPKAVMLRRHGPYVEFAELSKTRPSPGLGSFGTTN